MEHVLSRAADIWDAIGDGDLVLSADEVEDLGRVTDQVVELLGR